MKIIQCMRFSFECAGVRRAAGRIDARGAWPVTQGYVRHTKNPPARPGDFYCIGWDFAVASQSCRSASMGLIWAAFFAG